MWTIKCKSCGATITVNDGVLVARCEKCGAEQAVSQASPLVKRAFLFLEEGAFGEAGTYAERVLDTDPECAEAYLIKLLISLSLTDRAALATLRTDVTSDLNFVRAKRFGDEALIAELDGYAEAMRANMAYDRKRAAYTHAEQLVKNNRVSEAIFLFEEIGDFEDAASRAEELRDMMERAAKEEIYRGAIYRVRRSGVTEADYEKSIADMESIAGYTDADEKAEKFRKELAAFIEEKQKKAEAAAAEKAAKEKEKKEQEALAREKKKRRRKRTLIVLGIVLAVIALVVAALLIIFCVVLPKSNYEKAEALYNEQKFEQAALLYEKLGDYEESENRMAVIKAVRLIKAGKTQAGMTALLEQGIPVTYTFAPAGGTISGYEANAAASVAVTDPKVASPVGAPERSGYDFNGWTKTEAVFSLDTGYTVSYEASWAAKAYAIRYALDGGTLDSNAVTIYNAESETFTLLRPTKKDFVFLGWVSESESTPVLDVTIEKGSTGDRLYTAVWREAQSVVKLDPNGGTCQKQELVIKKGAAYALPTPVLDGNRFLGWYDGEEKVASSGIWQKESDLTLVAKWEPIPLS